MACKTNKCRNHKEYLYWIHFKVENAKNPYNFCDTDIMPSMPDDCSRCKRAYHDLCCQWVNVCFWCKESPVKKLVVL